MKYISSKAIIEEVFQDTEYAAIDQQNCVAWIGKVIRLAGRPEFLESKLTQPNYISIVNYRGLLPQDLIIPGQARKVEENDSRWSAMTYSPDSFVQYQPEEREVDFYTYIFKGDYIITNFKEGRVDMQYWAYPLDSEGYPLIPDEEYMIEAVKWYLIYKLDYKKWRQDLISEKVFRDSEQQYLFYIRAASSQAKIPSIDKMESIKNQMLRLYPKINFHSQGFYYSNVLEQLDIL